MGAGDTADLRLNGVSAGETVLHVSRGASDGAVCRRLTRSDEQPADRIRIAYDHAGSRRPEPGARVNRTRVIAVGEEDAPDGTPDHRVRRVPSRDDLTGIGIRVGETLDELGDGSRPLVACFDGTEKLFDAASFETAFEFCHLLTRQLAAADARSHFHLDPAECDQRIVSRLSTLFDVVVRETPEGSVSVRSR